MTRHDIQAKLLKHARDAVMDATAAKEAQFRANLDFLNRLVEKFEHPGTAQVDAFAALITEHEDWLRAAQAVRNRLEQAMNEATCAATVAAQIAQGAQVEEWNTDTAQFRLYQAFWDLLDKIMGQAGDAIWAEPGTTAHEALLDIIDQYDPEYSALFQAKMEE